MRRSRSGKAFLNSRMRFNAILVGKGNRTRRRSASISSKEGQNHDADLRDSSTDAKELGDDAPKPEISDQSDQGRLATMDSIVDQDEDLRIYDMLVQTLSEALELDPGTDWEQENPKLFHNFEILFIWLMTLHETWNGRVLFKTENGQFGFTSEEVSQGDRVCILYGGGIGYILRGESEDYKFISGAYVLGFVDGEIFEMLDNGFLKEKLFSIS